MSENKSGPAVIVIVGITGDLVKRLLFPSMYRLIKTGLLDENTQIIGTTRQNLTSEEVLKSLTENYSEQDEGANEFLKSHFEVKTLNPTESADYKSLLERVNQIEAERGVCMTRLYYLSIPAQAFATVVQYLGENGLNGKCPHGNADSRLMIEKPFGYDLESGEKLISDTAKYFREDQMYRIDHYVAKETVQNIIDFRFNNAIFESLWSSHHISRIDITATETLGIEGRKDFYEKTGALRDLIQSHLLALMAVVTMEEPDNLNSDGIHAAKLILLNSVTRIPEDKTNEQSFRGQYETYRTEVENPNSNIETYAAVKLNIESPRWNGVPIIIKTGKSLNAKETLVKVIFKRNYVSLKETLYNSLSFRIQPNEGIGVELIVKKPGLDSELERVTMDFSYNKFFAASSSPDAYERVIFDAIRGDRTLFSTSEEVIASWQIVNPILQQWSKNGDGLQMYKDNSNGPDNLPDWLQPNYTIKTEL